MVGVLEKRNKILSLMRRITLEDGYFTISGIADSIDIPRSTAQDWINRLIEDECIILDSPGKGREPAHYIARSSLPQTICKRIFTTCDDNLIEIYHECMSSGCASFCKHHHGRAGGALTSVRRDGTLLRERGLLGGMPAEVGISPLPAVSVVSIRREGDQIIQTIRSFGGPAYSLTEMMSRAKGVLDVRTHRRGNIVEGDVYTKALRLVAIGVDDTDSDGDGATFALAYALLERLGKMDGVMPIAHHVAMLWPGIEEKTAGNSCSLIEFAAEEDQIQEIIDAAVSFVAGESASPEWGIAVKVGLSRPTALRSYGAQVRSERISIEDAKTMAEEHGIHLAGGRGVIGALGAVSLHGCGEEILLNPGIPVPDYNS
ncbi:sugar-specific transcriptional regulator TrmB [Methanocalculus sp.]|uniref:sugar-specific transcriptional regulator TrmB n=1 Tax=Methanocalculus sp. TaxID=2004547 RepID=UPI00271913AA|nr:sugar-specific transcriptional regulator TrmB [Methanocalculus sp.]MDO8841043.1 sugar-specific transcriptional regulator TrmB [Methanocalculus sp.]